MLAFFVKEIPQNLAAVIVNEPMVQDWSVVYGIINRWESTQRMTEVSAIDYCYKLELGYKKSQGTYTNERICYYCHKKGHLKKNCFLLKKQKGRECNKKINNINEVNGSEEYSEEVNEINQRLNKEKNPLLLFLFVYKLC
ncbi:hypothetical protein COBT_004103 [Conglomerata obtusa]